MAQRQQVIRLYKTLLFLGREYPQGYDFFRTRLKRAFMKNREVEDPEKISTMIKHGEYVIKELEALYMLRKYRTLKRRYYTDEPVVQPKTKKENTS
ncbi:electron transfer flavoprotein regulatory factor 1 isoform X2 [Homalodisca vitripennis]|nr:electron transfer flavoprotein regulatory factor 1 isoform X2 [Homalodisca vitripennis]XP_046668791.1 electron transfer flavoprotein regulatory factor 1 isoform X2 [Homalodisca vitripennis]XP_046668792.1 electron transfer flavoprotein regulatory factor 1 isoform X2 [Homalodisca vitripennis]XP_046668793.1 electron transfer flavoprotein regulatory factor 1 isoform X2 [Homalodisca vitripennis]